MTIVPDYRVFDLRGSHRNIGREMGRANPRFRVLPWWPPPPARDFALACAAIAGDTHPPILDEYRGYAEAQSIEYEDLLQGICRTSLRQRAVGGCTSFAVRRGGRVVVGRNYDFRSIQTTRLRIRLAPDAALPSLGMQGSVPGGRNDGVNAHGLFVSLHVVMADDPDRRVPGIPFHLVPRILLETCRSVDAALDTITRIPHLNPFNYLLADPTRFVAVEAHPARLRVVEPEGDHLVVTNHYRHPDMLALQGRRDAMGSKGRADRVVEMIGAQEDVESILRDHVAPLCEHRPHHSTLWSVVADLSARHIAYAPGTPCRAPFQPAAWPSI
ncbi:MAG: C45 family autoproteolytic acyltransferase/hydrolase [Anaerolineae bacterium]